MNNQNYHDRFIWILIAGALLALILYFYSLHTVLTPMLAFLILFLMMWPIRKEAVVKYILLISLLVFLIWFIGEIQHILLPFAVSFILAYLFDPVVMKMEEWGLPRWVSSLIIVAVVLGLFGILLVFLIPEVIRQFRDLVDLSVRYSRQISTWVEEGGLKPVTQYLQIDTERIREFIMTDLPDRLQGFFQNFFKTATDLASALSRVIGQILILVLVPFLFFYILKDYDRVKIWVRDVFITTSDKLQKQIFEKIGHIINGFFRGQLIVCVIVGMLTTAGLLIMGIEQALLLGLTAGILNIVPHFGLIVTLFIGALVGLLSPSPLWNTIKIIAVIEAVQILDGIYLSPNIVGHRVGLHPVWVILSILIFSYFWGALGFLIAVPVAAILRVFISAVLIRYHPENKDPTVK
ncbi:MAG: AI-2E family transporter [Candidatus Aminicenantes bacterium]